MYSMYTLYSIYTHILYNIYGIHILLLFWWWWWLGLNLHLLHWQADSLPLSNLGSPFVCIYTHIYISNTSIFKGQFSHIKFWWLGWQGFFFLGYFWCIILPSWPSRFLVLKGFYWCQVTFFCFQKFLFVFKSW